MKKILLILGGLFIYQVIYFLFKNTASLPSTSQIIYAFWDSLLHKEIYLDIFASISRVAIGISIASIIGVSLGLLFSYYKSLSFITFYIELLKPIPPIAWIPIAIIIFGLGDISSYFIVFLGSFFPIFSSTYFGAKSIPKIYKNCALSFELTSKTYILKVLFPYSLPFIMNGIKIGIGMGWMSVIAAELIGAQSGLGYFIQMSRLLLQTDKVIVGMLIIGIIGYSLQKSIEYLESKILCWK